MQQAEQDRKPLLTLLVNTNTPANPSPVSQISCLPVVVQQEKPGLPVGSVNWTEKGKNTTLYITVHISQENWHNNTYNFRHKIKEILNTTQHPHPMA
jgi:hypothetical protein